MLSLRKSGKNSAPRSMNFALLVRWVWCILKVVPILTFRTKETIALYEERLSGAKSEQYELEQRIATLESRLRLASNDAGVQEQVAQRTTTSAAQIDNETLRDQVQHLQKKSTKLEEQLEDARASLERDVSTYQEKIGRIRMEEEQRKRDLLSKSREVEQLIKSEARARGRVEEIEEALRESTVALENARGEVEALRAELAVR
jgi:CAP-Gly domain-containing linker protein 1